MNPVADALQAPLSQRAPRVVAGGVTLSSRLSVYLACTVLALICNFMLGKDVEWDTVSYHLYSGFSALHDRFGQDYFGAGPPGYLNPYVYAPFYAMVSAGLPALAVSSVLAIVHSTVLWLTFELALVVCPLHELRARLGFASLAVAQAFANPILISQLGSSFADITTTVPVLSAWLLLALAVRSPRVAWVVCAGLLAGAATALKLTNAVHAVAGFAVLAMLPRSWPEKLRHAVGYGLALAFGFAIVAAPWSYCLERMFHNPFFPLLNGIFHSPEFTSEPLRHYRFIPGTLAEALWRPFAMIDPVPMVHTEENSPDIRYAVLAVLVVTWSALWLRRRLPRGSAARKAERFDAGARVLAALGCALALDWVSWLYVSGNSRYFLPMSCVAAVVMVALLYRLCAARPRLRSGIVATVLLIQAAQLAMGSEYRWTSLPWGGPWFRISMPAQLATEPDLYLTIGVQSNSFIAPYLARGSGLVNFSGGYALGPTDPNGVRIEQLIRRYAPHLRVLITGARLYEPADHQEPLRSHVDDVLARFGLRVDAADCARIVVQGLPPELEIRVTGSHPELPPPDTTYLVSCRLVPDDTDRSAQLAEERVADLVLDRLEDACPALFQPRRMLTEHINGKWQRLYMNTDLTAWISRGQLKFRDSVRGDDIVNLGRVSDWTGSPPRLACARRDDHYLARVLASQGP
ncbi:MAG TPA: hypothetical protein VN882_10400 [Steroidobacteraceae bacterium]|jgi:Glycosyltransferase family 87|nr:hypothetical protein [Steroidobacteraceae bacterium]